MTLHPLVQPESNVTVVNHLPANYAYATYPLQGATTSCTTWQQNAILVQTVSIGACRLHLYQIYAGKNLVLRAEVPETITALWCVVKGRAAVCVGGIGESGFKPGDNVLVHSPANSMHTIRLRKGTYQFVCVALSGEYLNGIAEGNAQLHYFCEHVMADNSCPLMQLTVPGWEGRDSVLNELLTGSYEDAGHISLAQKRLRKLLTEYAENLKKAMQSRKMHNGMMPLALNIWEFLNENYKFHYTKEQLAVLLNKSVFSIDKAFASLTNQTVKRYTLERCLLKAHDLLLNHAASVKCCLNETGMNYNCLLRNYTRRFGQKPSENKRRAGE